MPSALQLASPSRQAMIDRLVKKFMPTVYHAVGKRLKVMPWHEGYDDLVSAGMEALAKSAVMFRPGDGYIFHTYVTGNIWRAVCRESAVVARKGFTNVPVRYREGRSKKDGYGFPDVPPPASLDAVSNDVLQEEVASDGDEHHLMVRLTLSQLLPVLKPRSRWVLERRYLDSWTLDECAERLGVGRERVRQIQHAAIQDLRAAANEAPLPDVPVRKCAKPGCNGEARAVGPVSYCSEECKVTNSRRVRAEYSRRYRTGQNKGRIES